MANRFWIGGTGNWDGTTASSAHWATTSGGAGPATGPGTSDVAMFDASSGGGTVTVTGTIAVQSITCGAFTGTLDFSVNNNNVTLSAAAGFNGSGTGARTIRLGNGTWTFTSTAAGTRWNMGTTTNLTFNANSSTLNFSGAITASLAFQGGGLTYNAVTFGAISGGNYAISGANTFSALTITGPDVVTLPFGTTQTVTTLAINGSSSGQALIESATVQSAATISVASNAPTITYAGFRDITCTGGATFAASNSFNFGNNTGITITAPSSGSGVSRARAMAGVG